MTDRARKLFYVGGVALVISSLAVVARPPRSQSHDQAYTEKGKDAKRQYTQVTVRVDRPSSNVDISSYVLITGDLESDGADAEAIMRVRTKLPLAVQTKDAALFDRILARNFTFRAADEFWNREQYIRNRVGEAETWGWLDTRTWSCSCSGKSPCLLTATLYS